jgi:hypothetical protein
LACSGALSATLAAPTVGGGAALEKRKYIIHKGAANEAHWPGVESWVSLDELCVFSPAVASPIN